MANSLKDKVVVITGSTCGFGCNIAKAMLKSATTVMISGPLEDAYQPKLIEHISEAAAN